MTGVSALPARPVPPLDVPTDYDRHPMWLLTLRDLQWRRRRFAIAMGATSLVFALALLLSGVSASFDNEVRRTVDFMHPGAWLVREGTAGPFTSPNAFPAGRAAVVAALPGVVRADPVAVARGVTHVHGVRDVNVIGVVPGGVGAPPPALGGAELARGGGAVVDASLGVRMGDTFDLSGRRFTVVGLLHGITFFAAIPVAFISIEDAQRLSFGGRNLATAILTKGVPANVPPGLSLLSDQQVEQDMLRPIQQAKQTIALIRGLLWAVAGGIIGAIVYLSALERSRDFAVLKATGSSGRFLLTGLVLQAIVVALASVVVAMVLELAMAPAAAMSVEVSLASYATLGAVAVVVGFLASLAGVRRALRVDPALAFAGA
jgi:putative ABC transport system permease protein